MLVNELNTLPGFTATSVFAKLWEATGLGFPELFDRLLGSRSSATGRSAASTRSEARQRRGANSVTSAISRVPSLGQGGDPDQVVAVACRPCRA